MDEKVLVVEDEISLQEALAYKFPQIKYFAEFNGNQLDYLNNLRQSNHLINVYYRPGFRHGCDSSVFYKKVMNLAITRFEE